MVTGASSGIGEATAISLGQNGCSVALVARRKDRLQGVAKKIEDAGSSVLIIEGDVSASDTAQQAIQETHKKFGRIDLLINNAGVMLLGPVDRARIEDWQSMININVLGLMYFTKAVLPIMKEQHGGHIVNISSVAGRVARAGSSGYNASKWAVGAFSEALRQEVSKDRIRVTLIEPGAVLTELTNHITHEDVKESVKSFVASMEALTAEDIANAILYAVSQPDRVNVNEILIRPTDQER